MSKTIGSFGSWSSPITADVVVEDVVGLSEPRVDGNEVYWLEARPSDPIKPGRTTIVVASNGAISDFTSPPWDVQSQVHDYGGGAYAVQNGVVYFVSNASATDQAIYAQTQAGGSPNKITSSTNSRYGDICIDSGRNRLIAVREFRPRGSATPNAEVINDLIAIDLASGAETSIDSGCDFYSSPGISPDGSSLAWLSWRNPHMPWTSTRLNVAPLDASGAPGKKLVIAGDDEDHPESIFQPQWSPGGKLYFVSDRSDFWNIYRWNGNGTASEIVLRRSEEFGVAQWTLGMSTYAFTSDDKLIYSFTRNGMWYMGTMDLSSSTATDFASEYSSVSGVRANARRIVVRCSTATSAPAIAIVDPGSGRIMPIKYAVPPERLIDLLPYFSKPQPVAFPSDAGETAHAFYYPPSNPDWNAPPSEKPPLLVKSHGGPTAAASSELSLSLQYWTSRGFAVLDVNYRGSTGYGRKYREKLYPEWGIVDVADCIAGARRLAKNGKADATKLAVTGGSAGGYTTLCALTFHRDFASGASYYGISDLVALTKTHKFEAHYMDWLIGPYPQDKDIYHERSPINFVGQISAPVIFFQGCEDPIVPPDQAKKMYDALRQRKTSTCLLLFEGEKHGFKQAQHIRRALEAELQFYAIVLTRAALTS